MNKIAIPALLAATIMVAGAFAFMPVEQASTVHIFTIETIAANQATLLRTSDSDVNSGDSITFDCTDAYLITGLTLDIGDTLAPGNGLDFVTVTIDGDDVASVDLGIGNGPVAILDGLEAADANTDTVLTFTINGDGGDFDLDALRVSVQSDGDCAFGP